MPANESTCILRNPPERASTLHKDFERVGIGLETDDGHADLHCLHLPASRCERAEEVVSQEVPSWNQVREWLSELESLRTAIAPPGNHPLEASG